MKPVNLTNLKNRHFLMSGAGLMVILWFGWDAGRYYEHWFYLKPKDDPALVAVQKLDTDLKSYFAVYVNHRELSQKFRELGALNTNVSRDDGTSGLKLPAFHPEPPVTFQPNAIADP